MIIIKFNFKRAFSFRPFIGMPKRYEGTIKYGYRMAHEKVHYDRQTNFPILWILKYFFIKQFRKREELLAFEKEIDFKIEKHIYIDKERYIYVLSNQYWNMMSGEEATAFIEDFI